MSRGFRSYDQHNMKLYNLKVSNKNYTHLIHLWTSPGPCLQIGRKLGSHLLPRSLPEHSIPQTNSLCGGWVGGRSMLGRKWVSLFNLCRCNTLFKDKAFLSIWICMCVVVHVHLMGRFEGGGRQDDEGGVWGVCVKRAEINQHLKPNNGEGVVVLMSGIWYSREPTLALTLTSGLTLEAVCLQYEDWRSQ